MKIKCVTPGGVVSETRCEWKSRGPQSWGTYISEDCIGFTDKIEVYTTNLNGTETIGKHFDLVFTGEHDGSPGQFGILDCGLSGNNITNYT